MRKQTWSSAIYIFSLLFLSTSTLAQAPTKKEILSQAIEIKKTELATIRRKLSSLQKLNLSRWVLAETYYRLTDRWARTPASLIAEWQRIAELKRKSLDSLQQAAATADAEPELAEVVTLEDVGKQVLKGQIITTGGTSDDDSATDRTAYSAPLPASIETRLQVPPTDGDLFAAHYYQESEQVVTRFELAPYNTLPETVDWRHLLPPLVSQDYIRACSAFAITAGIEAAAKCAVDLSEKYVYALIRRAEQPNDTLPDNSGIISCASAVCRLMSFLLPQAAEVPWDGKVEFPEALPHESAIYQIKDFAILMSSMAMMDPYLTRALLAKRYFPIVSINYCTRDFNEDWMQLTPPNLDCSNRHAVLLVGYGKEMNPFTWVEELYFLVRDSSAPELVHYKLSMEDFQHRLDDYVVITEVTN